MSALLEALLGRNTVAVLAGGYLDLDLILSTPVSRNPAYRDRPASTMISLLELFGVYKSL